MNAPPWYGYDLDQTVKKAIAERSINQVILRNRMSLTAAVYANDKRDLFDSLVEAGATLTSDDLATIIWEMPDDRADKIDFLLKRGVPHSAECLHAALRHEKWKIFLTLLKYGLDTQMFVEQRTLPESDPKLSILHVVAWTGKALVVERLLRKGVEVDSRDVDGMTPLMRICDPSRLDHRGIYLTLGSLLKHSADPNAATPSGETALLLCFGEPKKQKQEWFTRRANIASLLLRHGANPDVVSSAGTTPLMLAARDNDVALTRVLLQANADRDRRTPDGKSVVDVAEKWNSSDVLALLKS